MQTPPMQTMTQAAADLQSGRTTARALIERCLAAIADPAGQGPRAFLAVYAEQARAGADAMDMLRQHNRHPGPYAGIPFSIKDLFDVAGEVTAAGSTVLADAPVASAHCTAVARMLAAGFVPVGRTNMTEFAFSGLGLNPHHGTPLSPYKRSVGHIAGGSSSGAAVSVADGMALAALGTDTGGSCRIPAAFCGVVGYKPTARRVPMDGLVPLSQTLDSVGPLARSVADCAAVDAVLAGEVPRPVQPLALRGMRIAVPGNLVMDGVEPAVAEAFGRALNRLGTQGARVTHMPFRQLDDVIAVNNRGFATAEAYAWHAKLLGTKGAGYDPRVRSRIAGGEGMTAGEYIALLAARTRIIADMDAATAPFDAVAMPTCPVTPPTLASLETDDDAFTRVNALVLRNPSFANFLDRCSISVPAHRMGDAPVGFMLMGATGGDRRLFAVAAAVEAVLRD